MEQVPGVDQVPSGTTRVLGVAFAMAVGVAGILVPGLRPASVELTLALFGGYLIAECVAMPLIWRGRPATPQELARWSLGRPGITPMALLALLWLALVALMWRISPTEERPALPLAAALQTAIVALEIRRVIRSGFKTLPEMTNEIAFSLAVCAGASLVVQLRGAPHLAGWFSANMLVISSQAWSRPVRSRSAG